MHAFELAPSNRKLLRHLLENFNLSHSATVHDLAASNTTRQYTIGHVSAGDEQSRLHTPGDAFCRRRRCEQTVQAITIDDFLRRQGLANQGVYHVAIDTEGYEPLVLDGMRETLRRKRVAIVEFEVSHKGYWTPYRRDPLFAEARRVNSTVAWLGDAGYTCFWQANESVVPMSGSCWRRQFEIRRWSNIVCAHELPIVRTLFRLAHEAREVRSASNAAVIGT